MDRHRNNQVRAYRASPKGAFKIKVRGRTNAAAATWVREHHPDVWNELMIRVINNMHIEESRKRKE